MAKKEKKTTTSTSSTSNLGRRHHQFDWCIVLAVKLATISGLHEQIAPLAHVPLDYLAGYIKKNR